ncbi:benzoate 4-monooxygenase [Aspergillus ellipticus CBS 707.79]|uniref:Benzoate 4-monooxygenase n=1 Tax=Aspergillus ellipticus CBS 707.79 TaxID=1448320 RepID=A0A319EP57_9EURO|nr:benzoate 4-monooxygenase [Aspergillus ellipticus CBS 707.79]
MSNFAGVLGVLAHLGLFIQSDWEKNAIFLFNCFITWPVTGLGFLVFLGYKSAFQWSALALLTFDISLCLSIVIYRSLFHALCGFPGPRLASISALWSIKSAVVDAKWHLHVQKLHGDYGDIVRIKPREISINDPSAIKDIYGVGTTCVKGAFYDMNYPHCSLQMTRDKAFHSKRRRLWDRGFSSRALAGYEPYILEHCKDLVKLIASRPQRQEATELVDGFTWDSMGILAFGKSFNMLHGAPHRMLQEMKNVSRFGSMLLCATWSVMLCRNMVGLRRQTDRWLAWCAQTVEERRKMELTRRDLFSYLIEDTLSDMDHLKTGTEEDLVYDSELAIAAGSDTTAAILSALLYLLARHPDKLQRLREEIDSAVPAGELVHTVLVGKTYLEGCINEGLRLYPAVMSGVPRETGPEGMTTAGVYIPPHTIVSVPTYTIHRDPRNFQDPDEFIPERWSSQPGMVIQKEALNPFSTGTYTCAGKSFAMMEMRLFIATIFSPSDLLRILAWTALLLSHFIMAEEQEHEHEHEHEHAGGRGSISMYDPARDRWEEHPLPGDQQADQPQQLASSFPSTPGTDAFAVSSRVKRVVLFASSGVLRTPGRVESNSF